MAQGGVGALQYLKIEKEVTWGTTVDSSWTGLPVEGDGYTIDLTNTYHTPSKKMGTREKQYKRLIAQDLAGTIRSEVWPSVAVALFEWALIVDSNGDLPSYSCRWATPWFTDPNELYLTHSGVMVNTCTISCSQDAPDLILEFDCIGYQETKESTAWAVPTMPSALPYIFQDASFELWNGAAYVVSTSVESFSIEVANNLTPGPHGSDKLITYLETGMQDVTGNTVVIYDCDTYNAWVREARTDDTIIGKFKMTFSHPDGSSSIIIELPQLRIPSAPKAGGPEDTVKQTINFEAEKPTGDNQIKVTIDGTPL